MEPVGGKWVFLCVNQLSHCFSSDGLLGNTEAVERGRAPQTGDRDKPAK